MSIYIKLCELASKQTDRPVGAPMFREWITALGGQWTYTEPPVSPGATRGEAIDKSDVLQTPYRCVIQGDSTHNLGPLKKGEVQGDEEMQERGGRKHCKTCTTPGKSIRSWVIGHSKVESYVIQNGAECDNIADDLEEAYPEINTGQMADANLALVIAFNGYSKNITSQGKSKAPCVQANSAVRAIDGRTNLT